MKNNDMQSLMLVLSPPVGVSELTAYLRSAARAVGARSDADLAKVMQVPTSTIANWKRRGVVSESGREWFGSNFILEVATASSMHLPSVEVAAVEAVLRVVIEEGGNPIRVKHDPTFATALSFGGMLAWSQFVFDALRLHGEVAGQGDATAISAVRDGIAMFDKANILQGFARG